MFRTLDALLVTGPARHGMDGIRGLPRCSNYRPAPLSRSSTPAVRAVARSVPEATGANADTDAGNDDGRTVAAVGARIRAALRASYFAYRLRNLSTRPLVSMLLFWPV